MTDENTEPQQTTTETQQNGETNDETQESNANAPDDSTNESKREADREARFASEDILRKRRERFGIEDDTDTRPEIGDVELDKIRPPKKVRKTESKESEKPSSSYERGTEVTLDDMIIKQRRNRSRNNNNNNGRGNNRRGGRRNNRPRRNE